MLLRCVPVCVSGGKVSAERIMKILAMGRETRGVVDASTAICLASAVHIVEYAEEGRMGCVWVMVGALFHENNQR